MIGNVGISYFLANAVIVIDCVFFSQTLSSFFPLECRGRGGEWAKMNKMLDLNPTASVITLSGLYPSILPPNSSTVSY